MLHYIAIIHKEPGSIYGASFPDVPGVVAAAESLDGALSEAAKPSPSPPRTGSN